MNQLVFLCGLHRSGTTPLFRLLRGHPAVSGFTDTGVPEDEGQHLQSVFRPARVLGGSGRFGFHPHAHMTEVTAEEARTQALRLFEQWSAHWDLDRPVLLEKSPPNLIRMRYLQSLFPSARFIVLLRHPVEVTLAQKKRSGFQSHGSLLRHWFVCHELYRADADHVDHVLVVRYENLVSDPATELARVAGHLGIDKSPLTVDPQLTPDASAAYRERWKRMGSRLPTAVYVRALERRFEARAQAFGYSLRAVRETG